MKSKKIYLGQELKSEDLEFGLGSIYLAGPRNVGKSWRLELIDKFEKTQSPLTLLIPETKSQLEDGINKMEDEEAFQWQYSAIAIASVICFWYPKDLCDKQSYAEFGIWNKSERTFVGKEDPSKDYIDWIIYKEHKLYPAEDMNQLVEMITRWIRE